MNVVFVAQPFDRMTPPVRDSSIALWAYYVAQRLATRGHSATIVGNNGSGLRTRAIEQEGVKYFLTPTLIDTLVNRLGRRGVRMLWGDTSTRYVYAGWHHLPFGLHAASVAAATSADVIHVMNYSQLVPIVRRRNPTATIALHMQCEWLTQFPRRIIHRRLRDADLIIGCSDYITELVAQEFPEYRERCVTVPNAAEPVPESTVSTPSKRRIIFVGRLSPEKGVHDLIVAFRSLVKEFPDASLHLIGSPGSAPFEYLVGLSQDPHVKALRKFYERRPSSPLKDPYLEALEELAGPEAGRTIFFEGRADHHEIQDRFRQAWLLVNPSLSESFGITVVEAMMMKVPVVATKIGGMQYTMVPDKTGFLVPPADPVALAKAMGTVLANAQLAKELGEFGRAHALQHFSWEHATDRLIEAYESASARRSSKSS